MWQSTDPRLAASKFADIVILRPSLGGVRNLEAGTGFVDADEGWNVFTSFEDHRLISADDEWDSSWQWAVAPKSV